MNPLNAIFLTIIVTIVVIFLVGNDRGTEYSMWFEDLKKMATSYGFTEAEIAEFTASDFRNYFEEGFSVEGALRRYLNDN